MTMTCPHTDRVDAYADPGHVFTQLVREVDAGRALIAMTAEPGARRRAALDALTLARDVLDDAVALEPIATAHAHVEPTCLDVEPTGLVTVSVEALRALCRDAGWHLIEHPA